MLVHSQGQQISVPGRKLFDQASSTILYVGEAVLGSSDSDMSWRIQRITFDASGNPLKIEWADAGRALSKWSERASLSYS